MGIIDDLKAKALDEYVGSGGDVFQKAVSEDSVTDAILIIRATGRARGAVREGIERLAISEGTAPETARELLDFARGQLALGQFVRPSLQPGD